MSELIVASIGDDPLSCELMHNPYGADRGWTTPEGVEKQWPEATGWHFGQGNPEFWHYADQLLVPGGSVLDIGAEYGRSSFFFAMHGMHVTALDNDPSGAELLQATLADFSGLDLDINMQSGDALEQDLGKDAYDIVLLDHTFNHFPSKAAAFKVLDKAYEAVKPGGHLWVRGLGKEDSGYMRLLYEAGYSWGVRIVDEDVIEHPCDCSGEVSIDPSLFFEQTELLTKLALKGAGIVHSQLMPEYGKRNVMFGEDFNRDMPVNVSGMITLLVQKPQS